MEDIVIILIVIGVVIVVAGTVGAMRFFYRRKKRWVTNYPWFCWNKILIIPIYFSLFVVFNYINRCWFFHFDYVLKLWYSLENLSAVYHFYLFYRPASSVSDITLVTCKQWCEKTTKSMDNFFVIIYVIRYVFYKCVSFHNPYTATGF